MQIVCKDLGITSRPCLHYDSRPEVEAFFNTLYNSASCKDCHKTYQSKDNPKIKRLIDALSIVSETKIRNFEGKDMSFGDFPLQVRRDISDYLKHRVILIRVPLPTDTDVAAYFEIMNNRGEQLQPHEVIKALIMGDKRLSANQRSIFATIWDACSQMNVPIQRSLAMFRKDDRVGRLFGTNYDSLKIDLLEKYQADVKKESVKTIKDILADNTIGAASLKSELNESRYSSIIDFPNFLTHVFKLYDNSVELNGDKLTGAYQKVISKLYPMEFIGRLLTIRVMFDRYVVKVYAENEEDENLQWVMHRPYLTRENSLKFKNTFSENTDNDDSESEGDLQKRIVKQLSMLQVSFRNRKYKKWLFDYLDWLNSNYSGKIESVTPESIVSFLDNWIENYFTTNIENSYVGEDNENALYKKGVDTPHFLFNFIDYLYWLEKTEGNSRIRFIDEVKDFRFRYYNSVEHHRAQSYSNDEVDADMIGNLCLISRRNNSSLNDKDPREKIRGDIDSFCLVYTTDAADD